MPSQPLPDNLIYAVAERFLRGKKDDGGRPWNASTLARWLGEEGFPTTREEIYPIIRQAIDRRFLRLCPPLSTELFAQLMRKYPRVPKDTIILDLKQPSPGGETNAHATIEGLADRAAERVVELIREVAKDKRRGTQREGVDRERVHIGFGGGGATQRIAHALAQQLASATHLPPLVLHALSSGLDVSRPLDSPIAFFSYFERIRPAVDFVGMISPLMTTSGQYAEVIDSPGIRQSRERAAEIDIVVTSLAQAEDEHGLLNTLVKESAGARELLEDEGYVGDVLMHPFSASGPIDADIGIRAVTMFDLPELVEIAQTPGRHVVLLAGPCLGCGLNKSDALRPLLTEPTLGVCNHLVTDSATAEGLLEGPVVTE